MFKRILVPLDGSERAESAIPVAARIARNTGSSIKFIRVVSYPLESGTFMMPPVGLSEESMDAALANAADYLQKVASSTDLAGVPTETQVHSGLPGETILADVRDQDVSLVVMCSGIERQRVFADPVLRKQQGHHQEALALSQRALATRERLTALRALPGQETDAPPENDISPGQGKQSL
ncbi:MAG TPA: universal stress protein [Ktedonobacteraceae bacterium]|nr:universal stress protein [Ktedonobacteraceae bacterium]